MDFDFANYKSKFITTWNHLRIDSGYRLFLTPVSSVPAASYYPEGEKLHFTFSQVGHRRFVSQTALRAGNRDDVTLEWLLAAQNHSVCPFETPKEPKVQDETG